MGATGSDMLPGPVTQPPPLFPSMNRKPIAITSSLELDYLLSLRQDIIDHMQLSTSYLRVPEAKTIKSDQEIDKLIAQLPTAKTDFDWELFPVELRPKIIAKRKKKKIVKDVNIEQTLNQLEKIEANTGEVTIKEELAEEEEETEEIIDEIDEEMDEGTDYANNYFDNGEGYDDEDDNLDDGPVY
ncbi:hypothetical protein Trydic_g22101 [Trypoxylus dichotomus]